MEKEIKIYLSKEDNIIHSLTGIFLFYCGFVAFLNPDSLYKVSNIIKNTSLRNLISIVIGFLSICVAFDLVFTSLIRLLKNQPLCIINVDGIKNNSMLLTRYKFISWQEISSIKYEKRRMKSARLKLIVIYLNSGKEIRLSIPKYQIENFKYNLPRQFSKQISENNILIDFDLT